MTAKGVTACLGDARLFVSLTVTLTLCFSFIVCSPEKGYCLSELEQYAFPGVWAQDIPTGWRTQTHLRYVSFDKLFDGHGHTFTPGFKVNSFAFFAKLIHVQRLSDKWQLTNVAIGTLAAHTEMRGSVNGVHLNKSVTGNGDWISTNFIGRWWNDHMIHAALGLSVKFPLGDYEAGRVLNIGENRYVINNTLALQFRYPLEKGILFFDIALALEWKFENLDTHYKDHDNSKCDIILTYFTSRERTFGFFVQPDYIKAIDESNVSGVSMHDAGFYTFGTALGFVWNMKPGYNINLKWSREWCGRELINAAYAPQIDAIHFMWTYSF